MFTPLIPIDIDSIYGGKSLPKRMAFCTPDMYAAIFATKADLKATNNDLVLSDLFRSYDMQFQAHLDFTSGKKIALVRHRAAACMKRDALSISTSARSRN